MPIYRTDPNAAERLAVLHAKVVSTKTANGQRRIAALLAAANDELEKVRPAVCSKLRNLDRRDIEQQAREARALYNAARIEIRSPVK